MSKEKFILTDDSLMYFGEYKDTKLANLPDWYCKWLLKQDWIKEHEALYAYLIDIENTLK